MENINLLVPSSDLNNMEAFLDPQNFTKLDAATQTDSAFTCDCLNVIFDMAFKNATELPKTFQDVIADKARNVAAYYIARQETKAIDARKELFAEMNAHSIETKKAKQELKKMHEKVKDLEQQLAKTQLTVQPPADKE